MSLIINYLHEIASTATELTGYFKLLQYQTKSDEFIEFIENANDYGFESMIIKYIIKKINKMIMSQPLYQQSINKKINNIIETISDGKQRIIKFYDIINDLENMIGIKIQLKEVDDNNDTFIKYVNKKSKFCIKFSKIKDESTLFFVGMQFIIQYTFLLYNSSLSNKKYRNISQLLEMLYTDVNENIKEIELDKKINKNKKRKRMPDNDDNDNDHIIIPLLKRKKKKE